MAVAQDRDRVSDRRDLFQSMADEHDRYVAIAQLPNGLEQVLDLVRREGGGRLVHDEQTRARGQCLCDLEQLPVSDPETAHRDVRIQLDPELFEEPGRFGAHFAPVHGARTPARLTACEDVLCRGQIRKHRRLLVHGDDSEAVCCLRVRDPLNRTVDRDLAFVRLDDASEKLHERRLASAVLADERMHGAAVDRETHLRDGLDAAVALAELPKLDEWRRLGGHQRVYPAGRRRRR